MYTLIDLRWFENQAKRILEKLLNTLPRTDGFFHSYFDARWNPIKTYDTTLVTQGRMLYNMATGYRLTSNTDYLIVLEKGADFLLDTFYDSTYKGFYHSCDHHGRVLDDRKLSYGHSFAIFGLVHAFRMTGISRYRDVAVETFELMRSRMTDSYGGLYYGFTRRFEPLDEMKSQNPIMHFFEAAMELASLDSCLNYQKDVIEIADFVLDRLVRPSSRLLPEVYTDDWSEANSEDGGRIDVGHAFEWAFLLAHAQEQGYPQRYLSYAKSFLDNALEMGWDRKEGGIFSPASSDTLRVKSRKNWWEQCEAIRALLHFVFKRGESGYTKALEHCTDFVQRSFVDPDQPGWFSVIDSPAAMRQQEKILPGKVYYHIIGMCVEGIECLQIQIQPHNGQ